MTRANVKAGARAALEAAIIDAAIVWAFCPAAGGYKDGPAVEDTCEALGEAVRQYLGVDIDWPPQEWWTVEERCEPPSQRRCRR